MTMYSFGIEEEYFVFDAKTRRAVNTADAPFIALAKQRLGQRLALEMLQSRIEFVRRPCKSLDEAREQLANCRTVLAAEAQTPHGNT